MIDGCLAAMSPCVPLPPEAVMSANASGSGVGVSSGESRTALTEAGSIESALPEPASRPEVSATGLMSAYRVGTGGALSAAGRAGSDVGPAGAAGAEVRGAAGSAARVAATSASGAAESAAPVSAAAGAESSVGSVGAGAASSSGTVTSGASASEESARSIPESVIWTAVVSVPR